MQKFMYFAFILIAIFLVIVYYKGSTSVISTSGSAIGNIISLLQGRNPSNGQITNYPQ